MDKHRRKVQSVDNSHNQEEKVAHTNGKYNILSASITGILGLTGVIVAAIISNSVGKTNAIHEVISQINTDTSNVNIRIDTKDDLINLINELISRNTELATENGKLGNNNTSLQNENTALKEEKDSLMELNKSLQGQIDQYSNLVDENNILKEQITSLEEESFSLQNRIKELEGSTDNNNPTSASETSIGKKVSIFDLDTFKGDGYWFDLSYMTFSEEDFIDTYENEYLNACIGYHGVTDRYASFTPTYLLDKKYSICEGQITWSKSYKNHEGSAWIEFYSGDTCIYTTDSITADSRLLTFSFSVENIEKLTIVRNGTSSSNAVKIIYPYLNLIEQTKDTN